MKRRNQTAAVTLLILALFAGSAANAQIAKEQLPEYMGEWYANYMMGAIDDETRINVAGMGMTMTLNLQEDGAGSVVTTYLSEEESEAPEQTGLTWSYQDGKILAELDDASTMELDAVEGELVGTAGENMYFVFGRERIREDIDWNALLTDAVDEENTQIAQTTKENPYVYHPEEKNEADVIQAYVESVNFCRGYVVNVNEAAGTFTADREADDYMEADHIEGTYEITDDAFVNADWKEEAYNLDYHCAGNEYVKRWDTYTLKEDLSNLDDVLYAMISSLSYEKEYPRESLVRTERSETEGSVLLTDGADELTCTYTLIPGADPMLDLTCVLDGYESSYTNYNFRA